LQKRDWIRAVKSMLVIFHFYVYEVKRYESSHNSFLWRQLTAWEPSPKTSFSSPECPQPLASSVPGKVPCKQSPGVSGMVASPVCRFIDPALPGHLESTRILGSARRGNGKVHNTGIRRRRPRSAGRNDHNVFSNTRRFSGRHCQIHADRSGLPPGLATIERFRHGQTAMPRRVPSGGRDYRSLEAIGGYPPCVAESPIRFVSIGPSATHESGYLYLHKPDRHAHFA